MYKRRKNTLSLKDEFLAMEKKNKVMCVVSSLVIIVMIGFGARGIISLSSKDSLADDKMAVVESGSDDEQSKEGIGDNRKTEVDSNEKSDENQKTDSYSKENDTIDYNGDTDASKKDIANNNGNSSANSNRPNNPQINTDKENTNSDTPSHIDDNTGNANNPTTTDKPSSEDSPTSNTPSTGNENSKPIAPNNGANSSNGDIIYQKPTEADKQAEIERQKRVSDAVFNTYDEAIAWKNVQQNNENSKWYGRSATVWEFGQGSETWGAAVKFLD